MSSDKIAISVRFTPDDKEALEAFHHLSGIPTAQGAAHLLMWRLGQTPLPLTDPTGMLQPTAALTKVHAEVAQRYPHPF